MKDHLAKNDIEPVFQVDRLLKTLSFEVRNNLELMRKGKYSQDMNELEHCFKLAQMLIY